MSGPKEIRIRNAEILDDDGTIVVRFSKAVEGKMDEVAFSAAALFELACNLANFYQSEIGPDGYTGLAVTVEDLESEEDPEADAFGLADAGGEPEKIVDAEAVVRDENKTSEE